MLLINRKFKTLKYFTSFPNCVDFKPKIKIKKVFSSKNKSNLLNICLNLMNFKCNLKKK